MSRIVVTGSSGFLGSHVADALSAAGHDVTLFDREPSPYRRDDQKEILGDVRDADAVAAAIDDAYAVYHLAAVADLNEAKRSPATTIEINVMGTLNVLEAAQASGVERLLYASSVYVHSNAGSVYRTSKRAAESLVRDYEELVGLRATVLRFGSLYGPRADPGNAIRRILEQALSERRIDFWGDGTEVREYIHVADAASLAVEALGDAFVGDALHFVGQERVTTRELVEMVAEMIEGPIEVSFADEAFLGRYRLTPYSFPSSAGDLGRRLIGRTHIDLGLGLLQCMDEIQAGIDASAAAMDGRA